MIITFDNGDNTGRQQLIFQKQGWTIDDEERGLRYGDNPGQQAAMYKLVSGFMDLGDVQTIQPGNSLTSTVELVQSGKHPGRTNIMDADGALGILRHLIRPFEGKVACAIMKHCNPCGVAVRDSVLNAYIAANEADVVSAFGGAIAFTHTVDKETAEAIIQGYSEVVVAPDFVDGVMGIFAKKRDLRVMRIANINRLADFDEISILQFNAMIDGGLIVQNSFVPKARYPRDFNIAYCERGGVKYVIERQPTKFEKRDMAFGWLVESGVTSNSVLYVKNMVTVAIGTGEQSRVGVAETARDKAYKNMANRLAVQTHSMIFDGLESSQKTAIMEIVKAANGGLKDAIMISDAFFPKPDGVLVGLNQGVAGVVQPGGSNNDHLIIQIF